MSDDIKPSPAVKPRAAAFGMVDPDVIRDPRLPMPVKLVYTHLATYCSDQRSAFPSRTTIARELGVSVRTVAAAIKAGEEAGLWTVAHRERRDGKDGWTSNLYIVRDFGNGYVAAPAAGGGAGAAPGVEQEMPQGGAGTAHELDHGPRPSTEIDQDASGEDNSVENACAAVAPRTSSRGAEDAPRPARIWKPKGFDQWTEEKVWHHLVKAAIGIMKDRGLTPAWDAGDRLGRGLRATAMSRADLVKAVEYTVSLAGTDDPEWGGLADDPWAS